MTLKSPLCVYVEKPEASFGETMNRIRSWLDNRKIQPVDFKSVAAPVGIAFEIRFKDENEASLFVREFP